ncbi:MAG: DUF421 domain-containing protein [Solirubrobacterales bacterium]
MIIVLIRTIILYLVVVIAMRLMGKKQIGQLQPFELVTAIMISELASFPMQDTRLPLMHAVIPIVTLLMLQIITSILQLKSEVLRALFCGKPSILVKEGKVDGEELKRQKFSLNDLMEELRLKGFYNMEDIYCAVLETSGEISIIPKTELTPATKADLNIKCGQDLLPVTLILDGKINKDNLRSIGKEESWLNSKLKKQNIASAEFVLIAVLDSKKNLYIQQKRG